MILTDLKRPSSGTLSLCALLLFVALPGGRGSLAQSTPDPTATPEAARCGNHALEPPGEECDDGGVCIGGADAGVRCTSDSRCEGEGVCIGGDKELFACVDDADCPGSRCVRCKTFGGDGCASNCTNETEVPLDLVRGVVQNTTPLSIAAGTSGAVVHGDLTTIPLPLSGTQGLTLGKERDGIIPLALKANAVNIPRIDLSFVCACVRAVAQKRCGGVVFNRDGTLSPDCTDRFTEGPSVCPSDKPCAFIFGDDNAGTGLISCTAGLHGVDVMVSQDAGGLNRIPGNPEEIADGTGLAGSAILLNTIATGIVQPRCSGQNLAYGDDHQFCTNDDPQFARGPLGLPARATTGMASGIVRNANAEDGVDLGPYFVHGEPVDCQALANGRIAGGLASAFTQIDAPGINGDAVVTTALFARAEATPIPTPCPADCNGDGAVATSELLTAVKIAQGAADTLACVNADPDRSGAVRIDTIVRGANAARGPCAASAAP